MEHSELKEVLKQLPIGLILTDEKGCIRLVSDELVRIISRERDELEKQQMEFLLASSSQEKFREYLRSNKQQELRQKERKHCFTILNRHGQSFDIEFISYTSNHDGKNYFMGIIDYQWTGDNELSDMKSRFLSIASHEFRTPLTGILSSLNLIDRYLKAEHETWMHFRNREKVTNHLKKINESVNNLTTIINKFLSLGSIEKGEIPVKYIPFDLEQALELQKSHFQQVCKKGQKIDYQHKSKESLVNLDKYLLKNIMNNLFSNAIKFSPPHSEIQLTSSITDDSISITISDQGIGIPEDEQKNIFRRFYRAKNAISEQEGTGLGLNIVKEYVELLDGSIAFESRENVGTTFFITFPNKKIHENNPGH